jgi:hypothetical protein
MSWIFETPKALQKAARALGFGHTSLPDGNEMKEIPVVPPPPLSAPAPVVKLVDPHHDSEVVMGDVSPDPLVPPHATHATSAKTLKRGPPPPPNTGSNRKPLTLTEQEQKREQEKSYFLKQQADDAEAKKKFLEQEKSDFLKQQADDAEAKKKFLEKEKKIVQEILKKPEEEHISASPATRNSSIAAIMRRLEEKKEEEERKKTEEMNQKMEIQKEILERETKSKIRKDEAVTSLAEDLEAEKKKEHHADNIPIFQDYNTDQIKDFILSQFPPDAISVLDDFVTLSEDDKKEILDFIILKYKAVTLNAVEDLPGPNSKYNEVGINSLRLSSDSPPAMVSRYRALLVCEVDPLKCPPGSEWCCCLRRDAEFHDIAELIKNQGRPFVAANPDIQSMIQVCENASAPAGAQWLVSAPGALAPAAGFNDPFPSVIIGDEKVVYSIGPIIDAEPILGRPMIMVRIHNYKTGDYPDGIYFWTYPSFSEGGVNRVFLTIDGGQYMKGPDYILTTSILDLLQVPINKYYKIYFVDMQGFGLSFIPTILHTQQEIVCFFGGMIHLQSIWVHDLIAGRGVNLRPGPLGPVPAGFNRHCYRFDISQHKNITAWLDSGIPDVVGSSFTYSEPAKLLATQFCKENKVNTGKDLTSSFPLSCCLTTVFHKYRGLHKTSVRDFFALFREWPRTLFAQGSKVVPGVSPVVCGVVGTPTPLDCLSYNQLIEYLAPSVFVTKIKSLRLVPPISTFQTGVPFTMFGRMGRKGILVRQEGFSGSIEDHPETCLMEVDSKLNDAAIEIYNKQGELPKDSKGDIVLDTDIVADIIFKHLPEALQTTIRKIISVFFPEPQLLGSVPVPPASPKVELCFKSFLGIRHDVTSRDAQELKRRIIRESVKISPITGGGGYSIVTFKDNQWHARPLYRLIRTLELGIYRDLIMSSMFDKYTGISSYPLNLPMISRMDPNPSVRCSFLNSNGQYVEIGPRDGRRGNYDFSGIFQNPLFEPHVFFAIRKNKIFSRETLERYIQSPQSVTPERAFTDANIPVNVHNKMFLVRLVFSNGSGAIQIVVCVSSTICVAKPPGGGPYISFGVDVQLNVISIGPLKVDDRGSMSTDATILATMCDYLSLGCMGASKKGEYSLTVGHQQFFDYFDNYFRTVITECRDYVSTYMSPFNCNEDLVMKHLGGVFENLGDNPISDAIRRIWGWWDHLRRVESDVCGLGKSITEEIIEAAITSGRRDMQVVVKALFNPIMEILDAQHVGEFTGDIRSEYEGSSVSGSSVSESLGSSFPSSSGSSASSGRSYVPSEGSLSQGSLSQSLSRSVSPRGGANKKYTKKNNHKSQNKNKNKSKNRKTTRKNGKFKRMIKKHTTKYKTYKRKANGRRLRGNKHKNNKTMRRYRCVRK